MKKIQFYLGAAALLCACTFGFQSCSVEDNPGNEPTVPNEDPVDEPTYEALFTYDFAAAFEAEENPDNLNGSAANGQAFYAWESDSKTDSKRQDYKGYTWKKGSVLPEVCHVWRRGDRINGNIADGGLKYGNNRDTAIDGLEVGSRVEIFYEGETPAVWIAPVTAEGEAKIKATINGEEAVSGVTTVASGDAIDVTAITPAENSETGYIALSVKKGTILTKVVISKLAE